MRLSQLIQNIRNPPHESVVGYMTRADGRTMHLLPFVILINLIWLFIWALLSGASFEEVILPTLITVPIFIYLHLCLYFYGGPNNVRLRYVAGIFALGFILAPWNFSSLGYLIFGFFMIVYLVPMKVSSAVIALSIGAFVLEIRLLGASGSTIVSVLVPAVTLAVIAVFTAYAHFNQRELRRSQEEILRLATLAERERIGRDLHDLLGHTLSVVALKSELARKLIDRDIDAARAEIAEVERVARDSLAQVRNAVSGIRSTALSSELLAATALLEAQGFKVKCETENVKLPHDRETVLALSLREAATNVRRHSNAKVVTIRLRKEAADVVMEVVDDGRGGRIVPGNGLNGMRERLDTVGGSLSLWPNPAGGTLLRASVPMAA
ncbi:MAG: histidine kinase [Steroidobacteraceae bacterium]|jgi:two-component system sensor histidine kinase DesK|nr:histidine kinase [Steroidobacteraceae bacterium]